MPAASVAPLRLQCYSASRPDRWQRRRGGASFSVTPPASPCGRGSRVLPCRKVPLRFCPH